MGQNFSIEIANYREARRIVQKKKAEAFNTLSRLGEFDTLKAFQKLRSVEFYLNSEIIKLKAKKKLSV